MKNKNINDIECKDSIIEFWKLSGLMDGLPSEKIKKMALILDIGQDIISKHITNYEVDSVDLNLVGLPILRRIFNEKDIETTNEIEFIILDIIRFGSEKFQEIKDRKNDFDAELCALYTIYYVGI